MNKKVWWFVFVTSGIVLAIVLAKTQKPLLDTPEISGNNAPEMQTRDEMILIPGGASVMGTDTEDGDNPTHSVSISTFYLDKTEVTNAQYLAFCLETGHQLPEFWEKSDFQSGPDYPNHPVFGVSWFDATAFAEWKGKRLPTEAEWEYAARGGRSGLKYPNTDDLDPSMGNYWRSKIGGPVETGTYPANGYGLLDMQGNVVEWVSDRYGPTYPKPWPRTNPKGPQKGKFRVIRGGGWHSGPFCNTLFFRNALPMAWVDIAVGFRCAKDVKEIQEDQD